MTLLGRCLTLLALCAASLPALALTEKDLLPVDQAFALSTRADSREQIQLDWKIAPGYYLYRHRTSAKGVEGFEAGTLEMPSGKPHHDEFFGDVETYHERLRARLPGQATPGTEVVTLEIRYQGCADAGVCYPPQKRSVQVRLPAAGAASATATATATATGGVDPVPGAGSANPIASLFGGGAANTSSGGLRLPGAAQQQALPLPSDKAFGVEAIVDTGNQLLLRFSPAPGYYLYRDRTALKLEGARSITPGKLQWPAAQSHRDEHFGDVSVYFQQVEVPLPLRRTTTDAAQATLVVTFQGCQTDGICYPPMTRRVKLSIPAGKVTADANDAPARNEVIPPLPSGRRAVAGRANGESGTTTSLPANSTDPVPALIIRRNAATATAQSPTSADAVAGNAGRTRPPSADDSGPGNLAVALVFALIGGLILNLMPCVLPILSLKVLGLAQSGESRERARSHAMWYTLGVLVAFAVIGSVAIALRTIGQAAGWGFQLQHPAFVAGLVYLMAAVGLSLSGVFTLGGSGMLGQSLAARTGPLGDFFTGVLACVVASPCVAPFMGPALAFAFTASSVQAMLVFLFLGLGLALPFLAAGFVPALARRLPRPGAWMETLKHVLAFPMYGTAIWLLWVLGKQRGVDAMTLVLSGLVVLALALWWFERSRWKSRRASQLLALLLAVAALVPIGMVMHLPPPARAAATSSNIVDYSPQMLDRLRADNRVVFVNMTADWCVTCKANERAVLSRPAFGDTLKRIDAVYMRGDYTNVDPQITAFLDEHKAVGVPLYVVYGPGTPPMVLPTVLTQAVVEDALLRAAR